MKNIFQSFALLERSVEFLRKGQFQMGFKFSKMVNKSNKAFVKTCSQYIIDLAHVYLRFRYDKLTFIHKVSNRTLGLDFVSNKFS